MKKMLLLLCAAGALFSLAACEKEEEELVPPPAPIEVRLNAAVAKFNAIPHPEAYAEEIAGMVDAILLDGGRFVADIAACDEADTDDLLLLIDKRNSVGADFVPEDLVALVRNNSYPISRADLSLRKPVEAALVVMAEAAKVDGVSLLVSSTYRSYEYQERLFAHWVEVDGLEEAERESARPGTSQHQLGVAIDFGSIEDDYAETKGGKWLAAHAGEYGFSLSFPKEYEPITGYRWECWHYRYIGHEAVRFQDTWFLGVQQYMIEFMDAWRKSEAEFIEAQKALADYEVLVAEKAAGGS